VRAPSYPEASVSMLSAQTTGLDEVHSSVLRRARRSLRHGEGGVFRGAASDCSCSSTRQSRSSRWSHLLPQGCGSQRRVREAPCTAEEPRPGVPCADAPAFSGCSSVGTVFNSGGPDRPRTGHTRTVLSAQRSRFLFTWERSASGSRGLLVWAKNVRLTLCFALEAPDWAIGKEFSDLCLGRSTHPLAQKSEGPV
jgi:hypothetical protein